MRMKLWILKPISTDEGTAWSPWYDKAFGFIVRAETEAMARIIADESAGNENDNAVLPWLDPSQSSCTELTPDGGAEGLVMMDFAQA